MKKFAFLCRSVLAVAALFCVGTINAQPRRVPDSLVSAYNGMTSIVRETQQLSDQIFSPEDMYHSKIELELIADRVAILKQDCPELLVNEELYGLYRQYLTCLHGLEEKMERFRKVVVHDSLTRVIDSWLPRFDTLFAQGQRYASAKEADSVRAVKHRAEDWWAEVVELQRGNSSFFSDDEHLKKGYRHIDNVRSQIRELSEKERLQAKDIILVVAVVAGVLAMVWGMVSSRIRSRKLMKQADDYPTLEI